MKNRKTAKLLAVYSAGHFLVDLTCSFLAVFLFVSAGKNGLLCLIMYNFCAFALQMPLGLVADKLNRNSLLASVGLFLPLLAFGFIGFPLFSACLAGVGNSLYHLGGGTDVLLFSQKQWMLGVFVSPGALGLFLGGFLAREDVFSQKSVFVVISLAALAITVLLCLLTAFEKSNNPQISISFKGKILPLVCFVLVVILRSYMGLVSSFSWNKGILTIVTLFALVLGKTAGGFLADKWGAFKVSAVTLSMAALLYLLSSNPVCGISAVFLFNMTMPITLHAVADLFDGTKGFAFGTLTFALFLGYVPTVLPTAQPKGDFGILYAAICIVSAGILLLGLRKGRAK